VFSRLTQSEPSPKILAINMVGRLFADFPRRSRWLALFLLVLFCSTVVFSANSRVRYLSFAEVEETLRMFADSGLPGSNIASSDVWDHWIREQDAQVRARIDRGIEDSISNLILYGTSYTNLPRLENAESAVAQDGHVSETARARIDALVLAVGAASPNERIRIVRDFLKRREVPEDAVKDFLTSNLRRFADEQRVYHEKLEAAERSRDLDQKLSTRGTLYQGRGLSADTSLLVNYALEDTLRALSVKGMLSEGSIRRIAVIGPGLDFTNKHGGYDFYPLQTIQPFAVMETVVRLKLGNADEVEVVTMDLNPGVNAHIAKLARDAREGRPYTVQLPRDGAADWPQPAVAYWEHFGEIIGVQTKPLAVPRTLGGVTLRAVAIAPRFASRVTPLNLNVVAQCAELEHGQAFDLVIATNILVYYDRLQQGLAMASIARMMNSGGIFLANDALSARHVESLKFLDRHAVAFAISGPYGDNVLAYRRQ
jgi:hypothetical protein